MDTHELGQILRFYDKEKGFMRRLFRRDPPFIRGLRKVYDEHIPRRGYGYASVVTIEPSKMAACFTPYQNMNPARLSGFIFHLIMQKKSNDNAITAVVRNIRSAANIRKILRHFSPENYISVIKGKGLSGALCLFNTLKERGILKLLTPDQRMAVFEKVHTDLYLRQVDALANSFDCLKKFNVFNDQNLRAVLSDVNPMRRACSFPLDELQRLGMLTVENRAAVLAHRSPEFVITVLGELKKLRMLTPQNCTAVLANKDPTAAFCELRELKKLRMLTPENQSAVLAHANISSTTRILVELQRLGMLTPENRAAALGHRNSESMINALRNLQKLRILTPKTCTDVLKRHDSESVVHLLRKLRRLRILTSENRAAILAHANPLFLVEALFELHRSGMHSFENRVLADANPWSVAFIFGTLQRLRVFTPEIGTAVFAHTDLKPLSLGLCSLQQFNILTPENCVAVLAHIDPMAASLALCSLQQFNILTSENRVAVLAHRHPIAATLSCRLQQFNILTPENCAAVLAHINPRSAVDALAELQRLNILTPENCAAVLAHADPGSAARALCRLQQFNILTPENCAAVLAHINPRSAVDALAQLQRLDILTPENCAAVLVHINPGSAARALCRLQQFNILTPQNRAVVLAQPEAVLELIRRNQLQAPQNIARANAPPIINSAQSTHTASVHNSASETAMRLFTRYGAQITGDNLQEVINKMKIFIAALPENPAVIELSAEYNKATPEQKDIQKAHIAQQNTLAKLCILRLTAPTFIFQDPKSGLSILQLLALTFLAIQDTGLLLQHASAQNPSNLKLHTAEWGAEVLAGVEALYILGLRDIQSDPYDNQTICASGTFNKLTEWIASSHPDGQMVFISRETIVLKLARVVCEEAVEYICSQGNREAIMKKIHDDQSIEHIWPDIQDDVAERMFNEFKSFYKCDKHPPQFIELVGAGQYVNPQDLLQACAQKIRAQAASASIPASASVSGLFAHPATGEKLMPSVPSPTQ